MLPDTPPSRRPAVDDVRRPPDGIVPLPDGPDRDDALADLYAWPATGRSVVRANMIASLDGGASVDGRSAGLGNAADQHLFSVLRDLADVILVGSGTVRAEGYGGIRLDAARQARRRRWGLPGEPPPIAVVSNRGLPATLPLFTDTVTPPIVITTEEAAARVPEGADVIITGLDRVNLPAAITALSGHGFRRIHCEGGPALLGALVAADLVDECCVTIAPMLLGSGATPLLPIMIAEPPQWELAAARVGGNHLFTRYRRAVPR